MKYAKKGKEYKTWKRMIARCHDPENERYPWYGARGIWVCAEWLGSFDQFMADMGPAPSPSHTIERRDNNKGYAKANCVWATWKEQAQNRRSNVNLCHEGQTLSMAAWAESQGMDRRVLFKRLKAGWSVKDAIATPVAARTKRAA